MGQHAADEPLVNHSVTQPDPAGMMPVAALNFAVLTSVALLFELPAAHLLAGPCLVLGYLDEPEPGH